MFAAELLLGGNPLTGAVGGLACCAAVGTAVYALRKKIPHPTEFAIIGCCFLRGGCHKHPPITLIVEVNEIENVPAGSNVYFYAEAGRFDVQSGSFPVDKKKLTVEVFERLELHVRQKDEFMKISAWRSGAISSTLIGELDIDVQKEIIEKDFPQLQTYQLKKEGKATVKVLLSFHKVDERAAHATSPLIQYALIRAAREAAERGEESTMDYEAMDDKAKLRFLSKVLEGPLKMMAFAGWKSYYFKAVEGSRDRWQWQYWKSREDMLAKKKHVGSIPLLAISTVLPDAHNRQQFYVKYYKKSGTVDVFLSRVDRDRDLWSDGLYEFLERLRQYLQEHPPQTDAEAFVRAEEKKDLEKRERVVLAPEQRTLLGPGVADKKHKHVVAAKQRIPASVALMIQEAMQGYDDEEEGEAPRSPLAESKAASVAQDDEGPL